MFFSTWETYHTHTLYLGYFNGPTGRRLKPLTVDRANACGRGSHHCLLDDDVVGLLWAPNLVPANYRPDQLAWDFRLRLSP